MAFTRRLLLYATMAAEHKSEHAVSLCPARIWCMARLSKSLQLAEFRFSSRKVIFGSGGLIEMTSGSSSSSVSGSVQVASSDSDNSGSVQISTGEGAISSGASRLSTGVAVLESGGRWPLRGDCFCTQQWPQNTTA